MLYVCMCILALERNSLEEFQCNDWINNYFYSSIPKLFKTKTKSYHQVPTSDGNRVCSLKQTKLHFLQAG